MNRCTLLLLLAAPAAAQSVLTVGSTGDFATLQAAVDAASPGDIIRLVDGVQSNVVIDKGVAIVGLGHGVMKPSSGPGADQPAVRIAGVPAGQTVLISGLTIFVGNQGASAAVRITDCAGTVWIQDTFVDSYGASALAVEDAACLVLMDSPIQTNLIPALPDGTPQPAPGARLAGATRAFLHDAHVVGSHGTLQGQGNPVPTAPPDGGIGLDVQDAHVRVSGTKLTGGGGNSFFSGGCTQGGDGGTGLVTTDGPADGAPSVTLRGSTVTGGNAGFWTCGDAPAPGLPFEVLPGSVVSDPALPRRLDAQSLVSPGQTLTLAFDGAPGDVALLFGSTAPAAALAVGTLDLHLKADALFNLGVFTLPTGSLDLPVVVPALPLGLEGVLVPLQAVFVDTQGKKHASGPRAVVIL